MALKESFERSGNRLFRYRGYIPLILLLTGSVMIFRTDLYPETFFLHETIYEVPYEMMCLMISLIGVAIRFYTVGYSPKNTSGRNVKRQVADSLNTTGAYSMVRHPLYFGNFFMWLGVAFLSGNLWFIISVMLLFWIYYERIMFAEEQFLVRKFGHEYETWASQTPAIIPAYSKFKPAGQPFNWRKVLKKEKSGILALIMIFTIFDIVGTILEHNFNFNYFLMALCCLSVIYYITVKLLSKYTMVFSNV